MRRRSNLFLYLILNIIVSAVTTLAVLVAWDHFRADPLARPLALPPQQTGANQPENPVITILATPEPTPSLPPAEETVIEIASVIGAGDVSQEEVLLRRVGEGNLLMTGWKLTGEHNNTYVFPPQPELTLYKGGAVQVFTRTGDNTATEVYWDRSEAAWRNGETIRLLDTAGNERARYSIP